MSYIKPLVSVIIPVYNKECCLKDTIESVLNQTLDDFELILIDDGSVDRSREIIDLYRNKDIRIKYYYQENQGVSVARNLGIQVAIGIYISFLDADDRWDKRFLEEMTNKISGNNVCYCGHYFNINGKRKKAKFQFSNDDILINYIRNITTPNTNSWLIKKYYIDYYEISFPENFNWGEDMIFFLKILLHDKNVICVNKYMSEYNISDTNCLSENSLSKIEQDLKWMENIKKYINENEENKERRKKAIMFFDTYRIPASIVYRIFRNLRELNVDINKIYKKYESYIKNIRITNGLRSIKLICFRFYLDLRLKKKSRKEIQ